MKQAERGFERLKNSYEEYFVMVMRKYLIIVIVFGLIAIMLLFFLYQWQRSFNPSKWSNYPDKRYKMIDDLMQTYDLIGMPQSKVTEILGEESEREASQTSFKGNNNFYSPEDTLVYYVGRDNLEGLWLILCLDNGKVSEITYGVT